MKLPHINECSAYVYDLEIYPNAFFATFIEVETRQVSVFEFHEWKNTLAELYQFINRAIILVGFNSSEYDDVIFKWMLANPSSITNENLYKLSSFLINNKAQDHIQYRMKLRYGAIPCWLYSIDVMQLLKTKQSISLKEYGCRMSCATVKESPLPFDQNITQADLNAIYDYNLNDGNQTLDLLINKCQPLIDARESLDNLFGLGTSVYEMSEAKIAQNVFLQLYKNRTGLKTSEVRAKLSLNPNNNRGVFPIKELAAPIVKYRTPEFKTFYDKLFDSGAIINNKLVFENSRLKLADRVLQLGAGGLHSCDQNTIWEETYTHCIVDLDVASYYPNLIISLGIYPEHLGPDVLNDYIEVVNMRLRAKTVASKAYKAGDMVEFAKWNGIANSLKIIVNAFFGKLGDPYSPLYDIMKAHKITMNGQLYILMLIERMHMAGYKIVSANTDGITIYMPKIELVKMHDICKQWEAETKMVLEEVQYTKFVQRDVNNYLALKPNGDIKSKGIFALDDSKKNAGRIITKAIRAFVTNGSIEDVVNDPRAPITDFTFYQRVKNGGTICYGKDAPSIGRIIRWVVGNSGVGIYRFSKDKYTKIPDSSNAELLMNVTDPCTPNRAWYIDRAHKQIQKVLHDSTRNTPNDEPLAKVERDEPHGTDDDA